MVFCELSEYGMKVDAVFYVLRNIAGCLSMRSNYTQGNIYKNSFVEVWNNRFLKFRNREWMKTGVCSDCKAWDLCEGNGMHLRDDDGNLLLCNLHEMG